MPANNSTGSVTVNSVTLESQINRNNVTLSDYDKDRLEDVGFVTAMTLVLSLIHI